MAQPENLVELKWQQARVELTDVSGIDITALSKLILGIGGTEPPLPIAFSPVPTAVIR